MKPLTKRDRIDKLKSQLDNERSSFVSHYRDLSDYILPRRSRFFVSDANKGDRRNQKINDSTATLAARTLRSGMMGGVTSPARPWFRLTSQNPGLAEYSAIKEWLHEVTSRMSTIFLKSNLYNILPIVYSDIGVFGTGAMGVEEDFEDVLRFYSFPVGSYWIANNDKLKVEVFYREFQMTVRQILQKFGVRDANGQIVNWENFSEHIKGLYEQQQLETWIEVGHVIMPNEDYVSGSPLAKKKKFASCYFEKGMNTSGGSYFRGSDKDRFLRESGFDFFPIMCPRWETTGEDVYGTSCPGMEALGDIRQLQLGERRAAQAIEKMVNPPMTGPSHLMNQKASILPGDITYVDIREGQQGFRPAHEVNARINELEMKQDQVRGRIRRAFYEDLFLMLANDQRSNITAREIEERHQEKLLALGPVLEQLNQDLLDPLIDSAFNIMLMKGLIPPPPEELQGMDLKVEYISVMAQAQKLVGISSIERFTGFVGQLAAANPSVLDKINFDEAVDIYGDMTSVPPGLVRTNEEVEEIRASRSAEAQKQKQIEAMNQEAMTMKNLSQTNISEDKNALNMMLEAANAGRVV